MQQDDPFITVTTDIAAPPEAVWQVLTAFSRYAAWHPTLSLDGAAPEIEPGGRLAFRLSGGATGEQAFTAELTEVVPLRLLAWQGGVEGVFFGRHTFELRALPGDGTRFTDTERWSGTMAASVIAGRRAVLENRYARSAAALKEQAEARLLAEEPESPRPNPPRFNLDPAIVDHVDEYLSAGFGAAGPVRHDLHMTDPAPQTDDRHPADVVTEMVDHVLDVASTWPRWDGRPAEIPVEGEPPRIYTPHKAIRRVADHLIDHLAELEARLAGRDTEPDRWHASAITTPGDLAAFTSDDLDEAGSRLRRLALIWDVRLRSLSDQQLDHHAGDAWTVRQVAFHVAESAFYADSVGPLSLVGRLTIRVLCRAKRQRAVP